MRQTKTCSSITAQTGGSSACWRAEELTGNVFWQHTANARSETCYQTIRRPQDGPDLLLFWAPRLAHHLHAENGKKHHQINSGWDCSRGRKSCVYGGTLLLCFCTSALTVTLVLFVCSWLEEDSGFWFCCRSDMFRRGRTPSKMRSESRSLMCLCSRLKMKRIHKNWNPNLRMLSTEGKQAFAATDVSLLQISLTFY